MTKKKVTAAALRPPYCGRRWIPTSREVNARNLDSRRCARNQGGGGLSPVAAAAISRDRPRQFAPATSTNGDCGMGTMSQGARQAYIRPRTREQERSCDSIQGSDAPCSRPPINIREGGSHLAADDSTTRGRGFPRGAISAADTPVAAYPKRRAMRLFSATWLITSAKRLATYSRHFTWVRQTHPAAGPGRVRCLEKAPRPSNKSTATPVQGGTRKGDAVSP